MDNIVFGVNWTEEEEQAVFSSAPSWRPSAAGGEGRGREGKEASWQVRLVVAFADEDHPMAADRVRFIQCNWIQELISTLAPFLSSAPINFQYGQRRQQQGNGMSTPKT